MNRIDAAKSITSSIEDSLDLYTASDLVTDRRAIAAFGSVNSDLPTLLTVEALDVLFADFAAIVDADSTLGGYLNRQDEAPAQEAELSACITQYLANLNHYLAVAGYQGEPLTAETYAELTQ